MPAASHRAALSARSPPGWLTMGRELAGTGLDSAKDVRQHLLCFLEASIDMGGFGFLPELVTTHPSAHPVGWSLGWRLSGWLGIPEMGAHY